MHNCTDKMQSETTDIAAGAITLANLTETTLSYIQLVPPPGELDEPYTSSLILANSLCYVKT